MHTPACFLCFFDRVGMKSLFLGMKTVYAKLYNLGRN